MMKTKRLFIIVLSIILCISMMPMTAFADDGDIVLPEIPSDPSDLIDVANCEIASIPDKTYTGDAITPELTVTYGDKTLVVNTDYTAEYSDNLNAGTATVTIKGIGGFTGTKSAQFNILKKAQTVTLGTTSYKKYFGNSAFTLKATTSGDGKLKYTSSNTSVVKVSSAGKVTIKGIGQAKITVYAAESDNYKQSKNKTATIKVYPKKPTIESVTNTESNAATLIWTEVAGSVTGYQIQYSALSDFSKALNKYVKGGSKVTATIKKLTKNTKYYFRVRAYKTVSGTRYYSNWSGKKYKTIKKGATVYFADPPSTVKFADSDFGVNKITWSKVEGAAGYEVYYVTDNEPWTKLGETKTKRSYTQTVPLRVYYGYKVRAFKDLNDGSRVYTKFKKTADMRIYYHEPSFEVGFLTDTSETSYFGYNITNHGDYTLTFLSKGAQIYCPENTAYNSSLKLNAVNQDTGVLTGTVSSSAIKAGKSKLIAFETSSRPNTLYTENSVVTCRVKYDGLYFDVSISEAGGVFFDLVQDS